MAAAAPRHTLVIGCGALGRELVALVRQNGLDGGVKIRCLPPNLHLRPQRIPDAVEQVILTEGAEYQRIFVAYGDCGTGGRLDDVLARHGVERLPGAHCYQFYAGERFTEIAAAEVGTFYLTDFLARNFERLVIAGMGLDVHPEWAGLVFRNYRRLVYLSQVPDEEALALAQQAADKLGLAFEHIETGFGQMGTAIAALGHPPAEAPAPVAEAPASVGEALPTADAEALPAAAPIPAA